MTVARKANKRPPSLVVAILAILSVAFFGTTSISNQLIDALGLYDPAWVSVVSVSDGDTIVVAIDGQQETVRFIGVDTPETHHPSRPVQCYGRAATDFTTQAIGLGRVRLEADPTNTDRDRYDRLLRYVYLEDGRLLNRELISEGYGFAYVAFPFEKMEEFRALERQAEREMKGLWSSCAIEFEDGYLRTSGANA